MLLIFKWRANYPHLRQYMMLKLQQTHIVYPLSFNKNANG